MQKPENLILVIFGASGDLAKRKIIPSLYNLFKRDYLPAGFSVLGLGRTKYSDEKFREFMGDSLNSYGKVEGGNEKDIKAFLAKLSYLSLNTKENESLP